MRKKWDKHTHTIVLTCVYAHHVLPVHVWLLVQRRACPLWASQCVGWAHPPSPGQSACAWNCPAGRRRPRSIRWWRHWEWGGGWTSQRASAWPCGAGRKRRPATGWVSCGPTAAGEPASSCFSAVELNFAPKEGRRRQVLRGREGGVGWGWGEGVYKRHRCCCSSMRRLVDFIISSPRWIVQKAKKTKVPQWRSDWSAEK